MPELPDVELYARRIRAQGLGRRIEAVEVRDHKRLHHVSAARLERELRGNGFGGARRHGKILFLRIGGSGYQLVLHFGMTGFVTFYDDPDDEPAHARLVLGFDDGGRFAFDNQRRFGWIELTEDVEDYLAAQAIGPDALAFDADGLKALLAGRRGMVKPALMDQEAIGGIGNVYADEILFQAGVRPDRRAPDLTTQEIRVIHRQLHQVLEMAIERDADPERMPRTWITPHRGGDDPCPRCGGKLKTRRVSGRSAWFCPQCQQ
jgi:formamidopyrimidine-DNA glycosylase